MRIKHENFVNEIEVVTYTSTQAENIETGLAIQNTFDIIVTGSDGQTYGFRVVGNIESELNKLAV